LKQITGNIIKPKGKKKYGGKSNEVKNPTIKKFILVNYF